MPPPPKKLFRKDLIEESQLNPVKDQCYDFLNFRYRRVEDIASQKRGIDVIREYNGLEVYIDEKAQIDYKNIDLPTFTFELSYFINGKLHLGWLYDPNKNTDLYYLFTNICTYKAGRIKSFKLTSVKRMKLIKHLDELGYNQESLLSLIAKPQFFKPVPNKNYLKHCHFKEKDIQLIKSPKKHENPCNLKIRLDYLIRNNIASTLVNKFQVKY